MDPGITPFMPRQRPGEEIIFPSRDIVIFTLVNLDLGSRDNIESNFAQRTGLL